MPIWRDRLMALIGLAVLIIRYIARYQTESGKVRALHRRPDRHRKLRAASIAAVEARPVADGVASLTTPHFGQTGPSGQRTLSMCARQASSVPNFLMNVMSFMNHI